MRAAAARNKEEERKAKGKEGASLSAPQVVEKGASKRKADGKDDRPSKKAAVTPANKPPKKKSSPKQSHGVGKGLMTSTGLVVEGPCRLFTHKEYAIETVESIIKQTDVDPCAKQGIEELGALGLFDLSWVSLFF